MLAGNENGKESELKEILIMELELIARGVQAMDQVYIKELHQNRKSYTNEKVFLNVLRVVTLASEGVGLMKMLHKYCPLYKEDIEYIEKLMEGYHKLRGNLFAIYREHSKNTEELY